MTVAKHGTWEYSSGLPLNDGDLYYSPDKIRDLQFVLDQAGRIGSKNAASMPVLLSGMTVTKGTGDTLNITAGTGLVYHSVTIPDTYASFPPSTTTADVAKLVEVTAQTNLALAAATLNGSAVNYIKVRYTETNGNTRTRKYVGGSYSYERVPSFTITVSTTAPDAAYDLVIGNLIGTAGGAFTIINSATPSMGWIGAGKTWTYASADAPTFTFTVVGDVRDEYHIGQKLRLTQTTVKYFIITKIAVATDTTITVYGGTAFTLTNATISDNYYSTVTTPHGFPIDPTTWEVLMTHSSESSQASAANNTWYNLGSFLISLPIGTWDVYFHAIYGVGPGFAAGTAIYVELSTSSSASSDTELKQAQYSYTSVCATTASLAKTITVAAKTTRYLIVMGTTLNSATLYLKGDVGTAIIRARCPYL